jgi:hypothetical protein
MKLQLSHLKSISEASMDLSQINLLVGANGSGKSILTQWIQLLQRNMNKSGPAQVQFPNLVLFPKGSDWQDWAPFGQYINVSECTMHGTFMGAELSFQCQYAQSDFVKSGLQLDRQCAQPVRFVIEYNGECLMEYKVDEHTIFPKAIMKLLWRQTRQMGFPEPEEWEDFFKVSYAKAKDFDPYRIQEFIEIVPEVLQRQHKWQETFYLEFKSTLLKEQLSIRYGFRYELCWKFIELFLQRCVQEYMGIFERAQVIQPKRDLELDDLTRSRKCACLQKYFGMKPILRPLKYDNGHLAGQELFMEINGKCFPYSALSQGQKNICRWVEEWANALAQWEFSRGQLFFESPRLMIIEQPVEGIHPQWQRQWVRMIWETTSIFTNARILVHAHQPFLLDAFEDLIVQEVMSPDELRVYHFSLNRDGMTELHPLRKGYFGGWSMVRNESRSHQGTFEFTRQLNQMYMRN